VNPLPVGPFLRRPGLFWLWLHVPVTLAIYGPAIQTALGSVPASYRLILAASYAVQAAFLLTLLYVVTWLVGYRARAYAIAVPLVAGVAMVAQYVDSQLYQTVGFHMNGLFLRVLGQPGALREVGILPRDLVVLVAGAVGWIGLELVVGRRFLIRFASARRAAPWAAAMLALIVAERLASAALTFNGGLTLDAASQVLPLQAPMRLNGQMRLLTGRSARMDAAPMTVEAGPVVLPSELEPASVRFTRTPDVLFVLIESLRADFLEPETMPRLWARANSGTVFERHYATSSSTHYAVFSLFYGLNGHKLESVVGAGRAPLLIRAMKANGYRVRFIAASSVDWMELTQFVFRDAQDELETHLNGRGEARDADMLARAWRFVDAGGAAEPQFLFLFFVGTHFRYSYPARSDRFSPAWDGSGTYRAAHLYPGLLRQRARNAAYEVDWKLDEFLKAYEARRGRAPLVIVTGDHGEAFGEHGRIGHTSDVSEAQIHVPMVILDPALPPSRQTAVTSHVDVLPTLLSRLGDAHAPERYSDGVSMFAAPPDRFVLATVGWEPRHAVIGRDLKATFFAFDAALGGVTVTDPCDRSLPDGDARFAADAPRILRAFRDPRPAR
jgi:membrane-anchored protein YejM (alkaline phosphatase superfamily)